jgi:endonuclease/exonuclease/phosphatase family metal-dependent hydrolase
MKRIVLGCIVALLWFGPAHAQDPLCGARGPEPKPGEVKIVSWNLQELATAVKVYDRPIRSEDDFKSLQAYRDCNSADVYALQEIASLRALGRVFPPPQYVICISGQTVADQRGLSPDYPRDQLGNIGPQCVTDATTAVSNLPGEHTTPARQYVALAIKRSAGISLNQTRDVPDLGPKDPVNNHQTRWGLDVSLSKANSSLRVLVVHMKSGCTEDPIEDPSSNDNCPALSRQLPPLKKWIADTASQAAIVVGDFNRRLDRESPDILATDLLDVVSGSSTPSTADDVKLERVPLNKELKCWPTEPASQRFPIDFFLLNEKAAALADKSSYWKWRYQKDIEEGTPRSRWPSDHCAIQLNVKLP